MAYFPLLTVFLVSSGYLGRNWSFFPLACEAKASSSIISNGLKNVGNTCYMNAQLQCAFHIPVIREIATSLSLSRPLLLDDSDTEEESPASEAALAFKELFEEMIQAAVGKSQVYIPRSFCMRLGIPPMVQQDSQEFWKLLLPAIQSQELSDLYKGTYEDYIAAIDGSGREKRRPEIFLDLSLDVSKSSTLWESLKDMFCEPELLDVAEGNGWRPEKGSEMVNAHKGSSLLAEGLPSILQFHLKRFEYDWNTDSTTKLNNQFTFPKLIDLSSICIDSERNDPRSDYELQAVILHMGEFDVGHYYSYVRPDIEKNEWFRFNDDIVDKVAFEDVIEDAFGGKQNKSVSGRDGSGMRGRIRRLFQRKSSITYGWGGKTSNAYVVQYVRKSNIPDLYPSNIPR